MTYELDELFWERPLYSGESEPNLIEYTGGMKAIKLADSGCWNITITPSLLSISSGYLRKYNPNTGTMTLNRSVAPLAGRRGKYYMNGYFIEVQSLGGGNYRLINWTTLGTTSNFADRGG